MPDQDRYKALLLDKKHHLNAQSEKAAEARKPVALDQQSIGRLSRQDALQQQEMAKAQEQLRQRDLLRINHALRRIEEGEYGFCLECGEDILPKRLEIDPMAELCILCKK